MASTSAGSSKLDYLKRYMSSDKDSDKKKKKNKIPVNPKATGGMIVIDGDASVQGTISVRRNPTKRILEIEIDEDEGPTVAEVFDETIPKGMQDGTKWKSIAAKEEAFSSSRQKPADRDISPRRTKFSDKVKTETRRSPDSDMSPPRPSKTSKSKNSSDSDLSPVRTNRSSPRRNDTRRENRERYSPNSARSRRSSDRTANSNRRGGEDFRTSSRSSRSDVPRVRKSGDFSPPLIHIKQEIMTPMHPARQSPDSDLSPVRQTASSSRNRSESRRPDVSAKPLPTKTLSGMTAGLQNAETLRRETEKRRRDEEVMFKKMDKEVSGRNTETVYRDRKTGKRRDMGAEAELEAEKELKKRLHDDKFKKWGKGLVQQEKQDQAVNEAMHEMSKPLARHVNDSDRDALLKAIDREGDPMLEYVSRKKSKASDPTNNRPKYKGRPPMNRYGIPPGYRWDGVDRSNGFEKERYNRISNKVAVKDQAYKWSTEDM